MKHAGLQDREIHWSTPRCNKKNAKDEYHTAPADNVSSHLFIRSLQEHITSLCSQSPALAAAGSDEMGPFWGRFWGTVLQGRQLRLKPERSSSGTGISEELSKQLASLLLVAMPGAPSSFLLLVARMLLVVRPGAPSSVLAPSGEILVPQGMK